VMSGTTHEIFSNKQTLLEYGLGIPQVTEVMHGLKESEKSVDTGVLTVDEAEKEIRRILTLKRRDK